MRNAASLFLAACLVLLVAPASAQNSDPFGGGSGGDPFASKPKADPFGGKPSADPFGGKPSSDPFGGKPSSNPFGAAPASDPFAASPSRGRAASSAKRKIPTVDSSVATARIRAKLDDETSQTFIDLPLSDAVRQLSDTHDIPIVIDNRALEEIGLSAEEPVNVALKRVSLRSFLRLMLREFELTYLIKDEVMQITTPEAAKQNLIVEMYTFPVELTEKSDKVVKALTSSVSSNEWDVLGGPCSVSVVENVLVVSCTESMHENVAQFVQKLESALARHKAKK